MKKHKIRKLLEKNQNEKIYTRLTRKIKYLEKISTGFILDISEKFILLQETDEFRILGYQIIPIKTVSHVRYNGNDKTYERILKEEGLLEQVKLKYKVDISNWSSIAEDLQKIEVCVISECEHPKIQSFCIGRIKKVNKKSISIHYFNAQGILDEKYTKNKFKNITKLSFDDHYANVFSKYVK